MSKRSEDKRRARAKEKQQAKRRQQGSSPLSRLAGDADACECWSTYAEEDGRIRSVSVMRPVRGGGHVAAFFLVDYDCLGLKDAFIRLNMEAGEVRESLRHQAEAGGVRLVRIPVEDARKMLAGAMRWTLAHPYFRMPADAERCAKVLGGDLDLAEADVSEFGTEDGGLLYIGRERDLERRLVGIGLDEFIEREDVEVEFVDEAYDEFEREAGRDPGERRDVEETEDMVAGVQEALKQNLLEGVRQWCLANGQAPHPDLEKAVDLMLAASAEAMLADAGASDEDPANPAVWPQATQSALDAEETLLALETPESRARLAEAQKQLAGFMDSFESMEKLTESLKPTGLEGSE